MSDIIQQVASKLSKMSEFLPNSKNLVRQKTMVHIYSALVLPYLSYLSLVWVCNCNDKLYPVITLQKRALQNITNSASRTHIRLLFKQLGLLKLTDICCSLNAVYTFLHHRLTATLNNYFTKVSSLHHYSTRSSTVSFVLHPYCTLIPQRACVAKAHTHGIIFYFI